MNYRITAVLALGAALAIATVAPQAAAQRVANMYQGPDAGAGTRANGGLRPQGMTEELPSGPPGAKSPAAIYPGHAVDEGFSIEEYSPGGGCDEGYCAEPAYCGHESHGAGCGCCGYGSDGQFFFHADYLYVRASFSEAVAFLRQDTSQQNLVTRDFEQIDFEYESSYRFGGGYRWCDCGDELRFLYTRFQSSADELEVPFDVDILIPFEPGTPPGGETLIDADVDLRSYDLECAKIIPLGSSCCECGDACGGCGDCCAPRCPLWDVTVAGGVRAAEAEWERSYTALDQGGAFVGDGVSEMDFEGVGAKISLEGRRYFFSNGCFSAYLKGDISVLWGELEFEAVRTIEGGSAPDNVITQETEVQQLIPVTELEAGVSGQITCNSRISAGYLLSAWHDLGFRDEFALGQNVFPLSYDDANILGFDGFFARAEVAY